MNQINEFVCPNCAETVKFEAKTCRFCGQVLNNAVKKGFPEFYTHALNDLSLEWLIHDYVKHVLPSYGGSLTAPSLIGNPPKLKPRRCPILNDDGQPGNIQRSASR